MISFGVSIAVQMHENGLDQVEAGGGGEKGTSVRYLLKIELTLDFGVRKEPRAGFTDAS